MATASGTGLKDLLASTPTTANMLATSQEEPSSQSAWNRGNPLVNRPQRPRNPAPPEAVQEIKIPNRFFSHEILHRTRQIVLTGPRWYKLTNQEILEEMAEHGIDPRDVQTIWRGRKHRYVNLCFRSEEQAAELGDLHEFKIGEVTATVQGRQTTTNLRIHWIPAYLNDAYLTDLVRGWGEIQNSQREYLDTRAGQVPTGTIRYRIRIRPDVQIPRLLTFTGPYGPEELLVQVQGRAVRCLYCWGPHPTGRCGNQAPTQDRVENRAENIAEQQQATAPPPEATPAPIKDTTESTANTEGNLRPTPNYETPRSRSDSRAENRLNTFQRTIMQESRTVVQARREAWQVQRETAETEEAREAADKHIRYIDQIEELGFTQDNTIVVPETQEVVQGTQMEGSETELPLPATKEEDDHITASPTRREDVTLNDNLSCNGPSQIFSPEPSPSPPDPGTEPLPSPSISLLISPSNSPPLASDPTGVQQEQVGGFYTPPSQMMSTPGEDTLQAIVSQVDSTAPSDSGATSRVSSAIHSIKSMFPHTKRKASPGDDKKDKKSKF